VKLTQNQINLQALVLAATVAERNSGENWYDIANKFAKGLSKKFKVSVKIAAGVIAALSPNNKWDRNMQDAETMIAAYVSGEGINSFKVCTYTSNKQNGWKILQGECPDSVLKGNKTNSFYHNILNPNEDYVTVDGHAKNAWDFGATQYQILAKVGKISDKLYADVSQDYITIAKMLNLKPCQAQAIVWVVYRRLGGVS
jgi:hypothetical protein